MGTSRPTLGLSLAAALACATVVASCDREVRDPPNVIVLVMDTTRADRCSVNGYDRPTTPSLERLAERGVTFRNAWSPSPWTPPSHASLFTGMRPAEHGLRAGGRLFLMEESVTLAERFRDAGYATGGFSNNHFVSNEFGLAQGFDHFVEEFHDRPDVAPSRRTHKHALDWVLGIGETPFFLFINDMEPHMLYCPTLAQEREFVRGGPTQAELARGRAFPFREMIEFNLGLRDVPRPELDLLSDLYDAEIATLDEQIGWLIASLEARGLMENTIVVVVGDHGENLGEHHLLDHMFSLHRTLLHVPLLVVAPPELGGDALAAGQIVDDVVRVEDVPLTLLELAGLEAPPDADGRSLLRDVPGRVALGEMGAPKHQLPAVRRVMPNAPTERYEVSGDSVVEGSLHLIVLSDGTTELYDVAADPLEERNLAAERAGDVGRLRGLVERR